MLNFWCVVGFLFIIFSVCIGECSQAHAHSDDDIQRGKEKWYKQPPAEDNLDHSHDHEQHHLHDHGHHHDHGHKHHSHGHEHHHMHQEQQHTHVHSQSRVNKPYKKVRTFSQTIDLWWQAILSTLLISAAPFAILFFVPIESNAEAYQPLLKVLLSFASGGLLGDAFLHLIPHALHPHTHGEHSHDHAHDYSHGHAHEHEHDHSETTMVGMWVLIGIVTFLAVEKFVRHVKDSQHHHHHHQPSSTKEKNSDDESENVKDQSDHEDDSNDNTNLKQRKKDSSKESENHEEKENKEDVNSGMKVAGYLNLAADFTHNFTDGLAIGASFLGGQTLGLITTATILLHEVPHEIGDFAILIQSGCSKMKAMFLQLSTATGAMAGCILGLLAENIGESAVSWILPFTAGGFIYIATVSVIPELLQDSNPKQTIKEILAMLIGIGMMVLISILE